MKTDTDLAPQLANCRDYWLGWGSAERVDGELTYYRSGIPNGQVNGVLGLRDSAKVEQSIAYAAERLAGVPWMWWVGPDSAPGVAAELADHGAVRLGAMPVMAIRTDKVTPAEGPSDLDIDVVRDADALKEWVHTFASSFGLPPETHDDLLRRESERHDADRIVRFIGRRDGRPVGTSLLYDAHGVAGVYVVATAEDQRRQGIGTALTTAALTEGGKRGLAVGTLQSSALGFPVYQRMGFEPVTEYELFRLPDSEA
ncbi:GNAT family N-acetyltransferase [Streptomyces sp. NPDC092369]|uniref:GNAT family N-acetyltransferase n=1 Tax=Streptomyces sp. NPDC092369 TaxID=3366015 RepID=UPI0037F73234